MIRDPDILHAACYLIGRYGDRAESTALGRAVDLQLIGENNAAAIWKQMVDAIVELSKQETARPRSSVSPWHAREVDGTRQVHGDARPVAHRAA